MTTPSSGSQLDALRRSTDDRMVAGVAGGIARALDIDPVIVRIGFVVLTLVGFAGPVLYVACWLLVPLEGTSRSILGDAFDLRSDSQLRTVGLIVAAVIAVAAVLGDGAWGPAGWFWWPLWLTAWVAIPVGAAYWFFVVRPRQAQRQRFVPPPPYTPPAGPAVPFAAAPAGDTETSTTGDTEMTEPVSTGEGTAVLDDPLPPPPPPPGAPPTSVLPPRSPREKWSPALLLVTLSTVVAAMGVLGLWSATQDPLRPAVYVAVALAIVTLGLFVGTRIGHPGPLVLVGLLLLPVLAATSIVPHFSAGRIDLEPITAAGLTDRIEQGAGEVRVDLTTIQDPQNLAGRSLEIDNGLGNVTVFVPDGLDIDVETALSFGGRIEVFDRLDDGQSPRLDVPSDAPGAFELDIDGSAGEILVVRK